MVPGYDEFVAGHEAAFTAGSVTVTVIQAALMIVGTLGAGTGLAIGLVVVKTVVKAAVKSVVKGVERTAVRAIERVGVRAGVRGAERGAARGAQSCAVNSFTAGTLVLMADGTQKPIEDVQVGDEVLATDPESGVTMARPVVELIEHDGEHTMVELTFDDGSVLTATDEHPFWDATTGAFAYAADLKVGEEVLTADRHTVTITGSRTYEESLTAYNLSIAGIHTYYAGSTPVLVHNSCEADAEGVAHAIQNHTAGGSGVKPGAGVFDAGVDVDSLAVASRGQIGMRQTLESGHNSLVYTIRSSTIVGQAGSGTATNVYQVIRNFYGGDLITMFPVIG